MKTYKRKEIKKELNFRMIGSKKKRKLFISLLSSESSEKGLTEKLTRQLNASASDAKFILDSLDRKYSRKQ